jgi:hypothetical protein
MALTVNAAGATWRKPLPRYLHRRFFGDFSIRRRAAAQHTGASPSLALGDDPSGI